ncbi:hypothetical protein LPJ64_005018 [Coemansia asiatica]|uniref:F-box domain-containing protein n=1 Tax=Coemansia asiatica TaxID=1052880 RepID=A0A9W7XHU5_9FUNG|nr:hypothetical protein LPJ64_005018 [Coemansia asiatica]
MTEQFLTLGPNQRIEALKEILADLSPYEKAIAKKELSLGGSLGISRFDILCCVPADIAYRILAYLRPSSLLACRQVSKAWRQYAMSDRVIGDYVKAARQGSRIPSELSGTHSAFRWFADRELRWERARPALAKTIEVANQISALAVGGSLVAASCGRSLKVWRISGTCLRQIVNVRANTANRISICSSGKHLAYSSYMREAKVYSVPSGNLLFEVRSAVAPIDQVDIFRDLLAVLKRGNTIEIHNWRQRTLITRFQQEQSAAAAACAMRLCTADLLVIALADWSVLIYSIGQNMLLYRWSAQLLARAGSSIPSADSALRMKTAVFDPSSALILVTLFNKSNSIFLAIDPNKQRAHVYNYCKLDLNTLDFLDMHFLYKLAAYRGKTSSPVLHPVCCSTSGNHLCSLRVPRPVTSTSDSRQSIDAVPDIASTDDNIAALGFSSAKLITIFSFCR